MKFLNFAFQITFSGENNVVAAVSDITQNQRAKINWMDSRILTDVLTLYIFRKFSTNLGQILQFPLHS